MNGAQEILEPQRFPALFLADVEHLGEAGVGVDPVGGDIPVPGAEGMGRLQRQPLPRLVAPQGCFRVMALGDIARRAGDGDDLARGVGHRVEDIFIHPPSLRAVKGHDALDRHSGGGDFIDLAAMHLGMPGFIAKLDAGFSDGVIPGLAPHVQQRLVGVDEPVLKVEGIDEVGRVGNQRLIKLRRGFLVRHGYAFRYAPSLSRS